MSARPGSGGGTALRRVTGAAGIFVACVAVAGAFVVARDHARGRLWLAATWSEPWRTMPEDAGDGGASVCVSEDGSRALSASLDRTGQQIGSQRASVKVWDVGSGRLLATIPGRASSVALSRDGKRALLGLEDGSLELRETTDGSLVSALPAAPGTSSGGEARSLVLDEKTALAVDRGGSVLLWDPTGGKALRSIACGGSVVALLPGRQKALVGGFGGRLAVVDLGSGKVDRELKNDGESVWSLAVSRDGSRCLCAGRQDGAIELRETATGKVLRTLQGHARTAWCVRFSPDETLAVSSGMDSTVRLWDVAAGAEAGRFTLPEKLRYHSFAGQTVAFTPDGRSVIAAVSLGGVFQLGVR